MTPLWTITETEWQGQIIQLAHMLGWRHNHTRRTIGRGHRWTTATSCVGWPDLVLWNERQQRVLFVELKSQGGRLGYDQELVLDSLRRAGCEVHVFRPGDLDRVKEVLTGAVRRS